MLALVTDKGSEATEETGSTLAGVPHFAERLFTSLVTRSSRDSGAIAIRYFDHQGNLQQRTYCGLLADIQAAVDRLQAGGVRRGMRIGILAKNRYEWVVTDFALIRLECTSVVFAEEFSSKTSGELIEQYDLSLLLLSKFDAWPATARGEYTAYLDDEESIDQVLPGGGFEEPPIPSIIFSSGTEGAMKCMSVDHEGLDQGVGYFRDAFKFDEKDSLLVFLPLSSNQQRAMVYEGIKSGYCILLVPFTELMRGLETLHPSMLVAPPLFFETVHAEFEKMLARWPELLAGAFSNLMVGVQRLPYRLSMSLRKRIFAKLHTKFGGGMRLMLTGMAPIKSTTLQFYEMVGLPLYQVYGLTEVGPIAMNTPGNNLIGSVGKPVTQGSVLLAEDGEILVCRDRFIVREYLGVPEEISRQTFVAKNTVATGDLGRFDDNGNLYIIGRKKQTIVLGSGYKVSPEVLESQLNILPNVDRSVVFGSNRSFITAVISMRPDHASKREEIGEQIARINQSLPERSRVIAFFLTEHQFRMDNGLLTRTLKLNRKAIEEMFTTELEAMYMEGKSVFQAS